MKANPEDPVSQNRIPASTVVDLEEARARRDAFAFEGAPDDLFDPVGYTGNTDLIGPVVEGELVDDEPLSVPAPAPKDPAPAPAVKPMPAIEPAAPAGDVVDADPAAYDPPAKTAREADRRRVLPDWMTTPATAASATRWGIGYAAHVSAFHAVRAPWYVIKLLVRSPIGLGHVVAAIWGWVFDTAHIEARERAMADDYLLTEARHHDRVHNRLLVLAFSAAPAAATITAFVIFGQWWHHAIAAAAAAIALGWAGSNHDKPIVTTRAIDTAKTPPLTSELIVEALSLLGLTRMDPDRIRFVTPICRDGSGWRVDIDLPPGVTAGEVVERRDRLASALQRPEGCVWPEADKHAHAARLVLYVADHSLSDAEPLRWSLATAGKTNIFDPIPLGADQRNRPVQITLMYASGLIGAVPRMGKTFTLRLVALAAALDPRVEIHAYDLKGVGDLLPLEAVAHALRTGDDPEDIEYLRGDLLALKAELRRRAKVIKGLPKEMRPSESKLTDVLADALEMRPILFMIDETQVAFENKTYGAEIEELVSDLVRRGPALGIMVWLATQRPDAKSIPTGISANIVLRLCLKVTGQTENDMVLGTSKYKAGVRATMFSFDDKGIAWLDGDGADPVIVRSAYVDVEQADEIAARARAARIAAGTLSGMAAGEEEADTDKSTVLDHLLSVWPATEPQLHGETLAQRLASAKPELYHGWTAEQVHAAANARAVTAKQIKVDGRNRRGLVRRDVTDALGHTDSTEED